MADARPLTALNNGDGRRVEKHHNGEMEPPSPRLRNTRKTECGAKQFLLNLEVGAAPFALKIAIVRRESAKIDRREAG